MFIGELVVRRIIGLKNTWQLVEPLEYRKVLIDIIVPAGFIFDFASVPKIFWNIFAPNGGRYDRASCLHDWLYATKMLERKKCDMIFYFAMIDDDTPRWKAKIFYFAVRAFGWIAWRNVKDDEAAKLRRYNCMRKIEGVGI